MALRLLGLTITLLAYLMDFALAWLARRGFAWAYAGRSG